MVVLFIGLSITVSLLFLISYPLSAGKLQKYLSIFALIINPIYLTLVLWWDLELARCLLERESASGEKANYARLDISLVEMIREFTFSF